ncbi:MAG: hypothetical protein ABJ275_02175 [Maricaulaceae bacterium]
MKLPLSIVLTLVGLVGCAKAKDTNCKVSFESNDGEVTFTDALGLDLSKGQSFTLPNELRDVSSILCSREGLKLETADFLAVSAVNKPIMLTDDETIIVVEMVKGQFRLRIIKGEPSQEQINTAQSFMNEAQSIIQGD